jgi:hypothetical protein
VSTNSSFNNRVTHESNFIEPSPGELTSSFTSFTFLAMYGFWLRFFFFFFFFFLRKASLLVSGDPRSLCSEMINKRLRF